MKVLEEIKVGKITLKNRIMFPPLTTGYEQRDGSIGEQSFNFYKRLAQGGVGYIVIGDVAPVNTVSPTPKLFQDEQIETYKKLADAIHEYDCKLGIQIFHPEYDVDALAELFKKGDMQAARAKLHHDMTHYIDEVTVAQLQDILEKIKDCAIRANKAGIDIIQVHGDRLVGSLTSTILNHRSDEYGGSFENRTRFALEVVKAIKNAAPDICIDYKLPIISTNPTRGKGGVFIEEGIQLAKLLEEAGVDMLHVAQANHTGNMGDTIPAMGCQPYSFFVDYASRIKEAVSIPVSTVGRIVTPQNAESIIASGKVDMVGLGRSLLTDPDFVNKMQEGKVEDIRLCMMCNKGCTDSIQNRKFLSCVLNAENGYEYTRTITPSTTKKKVVIIGGGPAGLEAARVAAIKGHEVVLYEKETRLGGQLNIASIPPRKAEMNRATHFLTHAIMKLGVDIKVGKKVCANCILEQKPDEVIVAVGGQNAIPPINGVDQPHVLDAWKVLNHEQICSGEVVVIGGGLVGCETSEYLANNGCRVTIIEMMEDIAKEESTTVKPTMLEDFSNHNVKILTKTKVTNITPTQVECLDENNELVVVSSDYVVMASGSKSVSFDIAPLQKAGIEVKVIGDCKAIGDINNAIEQGYLAANEL